MLLVTVYWRTNLTMRQMAQLFGISKSVADRIVDHLGPLMSLRSRHRFSKDTVLIVDGALVPARDHELAEQSKTSHVAGGSSRAGQPATTERPPACPLSTGGGSVPGTLESPDVSMALGGGVTNRSQAWDFVRWFAGQWTGRPLQPEDGYAEEELMAAESELGVELPAALREGYSLLGHRDDLTQH